MARLTRTDGGRQDLFPLTADVVAVGRASDQDLTVAEARVSRHHGTFRRAGSTWTYTDDGSSNGTTVNGRPVIADRPVTLQHGDRLAVGPATFVFQSRPS